MLEIATKSVFIGTMVFVIMEKNALIFMKKYLNANFKTGLKIIVVPIFTIISPGTIF